jgi:hypothetical protein
MDEQRFDTLAKMVSNGRGSRRRVLTVLVLAALVTGLPHRAEALSRSACRAKGGLPRKKGNCRCARTCDEIDQTQFPCHENPDCHCAMTASGKGLCSANTGGSGDNCSSSKECPTGQYCLVLPGCQFSDERCKEHADCSSFFGRGCIQGHCQVTFCGLPCPT